LTCIPKYILTVAKQYKETLFIFEIIKIYSCKSMLNNFFYDLKNKQELTAKLSSSLGEE